MKKIDIEFINKILERVSDTFTALSKTKSEPVFSASYQTGTIRMSTDNIDKAHQITYKMEWDEIKKWMKY